MLLPHILVLCYSTTEVRDRARAKRKKKKKNSELSKSSKGQIYSSSFADEHTNYI